MRSLLLVFSILLGLNSTAMTKEEAKECMEENWPEITDKRDEIIDGCWAVESLWNNEWLIETENNGRVSIFDVLTTCEEVQNVFSNMLTFMENTASNMKKEEKCSQGPAYTGYGTPVILTTEFYTQIFK